MPKDNTTSENGQPVSAITFSQLADRIVVIDDTMRQQAAHAINCMLTARNWFIGCYIAEFELNGADRAQYGDQLFKKLAQRINRKGLQWRHLYNFRLFYSAYPQLKNEILSYLQSQMQGLLPEQNKILRSLPAKLQISEIESIGILQPVVAKSLEPWQTTPDRLFHRINYTCLQMLSEIDDPLKRAFYEYELIQGCWTKRQLERQISSLYYERSALSKDKAALKRYMQKSSEPLESRHIIRDPLTLEFLEIPETEVYTETKLESAILNNLQRFLMELGIGFCFEERQKRVLIGHDYFKADLILYNRILHCHFIVELLCCAQHNKSYVA